MDPAKKKTSAIDPDFAQPAIYLHHDPESTHRNCTPFGGFLEDALVDEIKKLRNHRKNGDSAFLQRTQKFGRIQSFQIDDARPACQWQHKIGHLCEHVEHRQYAEHSV